MKKQPAKRTEKNCPIKAYAARATETTELLKLVDDGMIDCTRATWADAESLKHVRDLLVQAAFALGKITAEEALARFGVKL